MSSPDQTSYTLSNVREMTKFLARHLRYECDSLGTDKSDQISEVLTRSNLFLKGKDNSRLQAIGKELQKTIERYFPRTPDAGWRENVEVLFVAFILAFAIRTYLLQPFQIPTASMQPTLFGIEMQGQQIPEAEYPGVFKKIWEKFVYGKSYIRILAEQDGRINFVSDEGNLSIRNIQIKAYNFLFLYWLQFSSVTVDGKKHWVWMPSDYVFKALVNRGNQPYSKGEAILSACVQTGDFVFVDKVTYHFRKPARGDVFVFLTDNIDDITLSQRLRGVMGAEYYIKRLSAIGGDSVQIIEPRLYVNGGLAQFNEMYEKIYSLEGGYSGYTHLEGNYFLKTDKDIISLPPKSYLALGDNSPNSWDGRAWGTVPAENVIGKAFIVFYPFGSRWGLIH